MSRRQDWKGNVLRAALCLLCLILAAAAALLATSRALWETLTILTQMPTGPLGWEL